jgi:hypothetical protein
MPNRKILDQRTPVIILRALGTYSRPSNCTLYYLARQCERKVYKICGEVEICVFCTLYIVVADGHYCL